MSAVAGEPVGRAGKIGGFAKATVLLVALRGTTIAAKLLLTILVGRLMGLEDLGLYGLISAAVILVPAIGSLGLMSLVGRELVGQSPGEIVSNLRHYAPAAGLFYLVTAPLALVVAVLWFGYPAILSVLIVAVIILEHGSSDAITILNNRTRTVLANVLLFAKSGAWMIAFIAACFAWPGSAIATLNALLVFWAVACLISIGMFFYATRSWPWLDVLPTRLTLDWYRRRTRRSALLLVNDVSNNTALYIDRYIIVLFLGLEAAGLYFFFWSATNAVFNVVQTGVVWAHRGHMIKAHGGADKAAFGSVFRSLVRQTAAITILLSAILIAVFPTVVGFLDEPGASIFMPLLWLLVAGLGLRVAVDVAGQGLYAKGLDEVLVTTSLAMLPLSLALNIVLLPLLGLYGAAVAWIVNCALTLGVRILYFEGRAPMRQGLLRWRSR
jgi:O-antigen/teichoic acid export membrane protein